MAFDKALLAPRWEGAKENQASACIKYESSGGYLAYTYQKEDNQLLMSFTGTASITNLQVLLPDDKEVKSAYLNGKEIPVSIKKIEKSQYLHASANGKRVHALNVHFEK